MHEIIFQNNCINMQILKNVNISMHRNRGILIEDEKIQMIMSFIEK